MRFALCGDIICGYDPSLPSHERFCATLTWYDSVPRYSAKYQSEREHSSAPTISEPMVPSCSRHPHRLTRRPYYAHTPLPSSNVASSQPSNSSPRGKPVKGLFSIASFLLCRSGLRATEPQPTPHLCGAERQCRWRRQRRRRRVGRWDELTVTADTERDNEGLLNPSPRIEPHCDTPPATYEDTEVEVRTPVPYRFEQEAADANLSGRRRLRVSKPDDEHSRGKPKR
ncbi:hypothetical protein K438DRAFT_2165725 [Mycena galopus ATCC 62051]|nr:hypothetical protein K438DRAFT_2165725 [Mycena galopus ATCC 62051]